MILDVTQEDIDKGVPGDGSHCAIAHCLRRLGNTRIWVSMARMAWETPTGEECETEDVPQPIQDFIDKYDNSPSEERPKPELFDLDVVCE